MLIASNNPTHWALGRRALSLPWECYMKQNPPGNLSCQEAQILPTFLPLEWKELGRANCE